MKRKDLKENGFSPGKWLARTTLALLTTLALSIPAAFGANTIVSPDYANPLLSQASQGYGLPGFIWNNIIPNALADYFTFRPYSTADAVALGFPSTCGAAGPTGEDCYTITAKRFPQPLSLYFLGAPFASSTLTGANSLGLKDANGVPATGAAGVPFTGATGANLTAGTDVFGYGSGGNGWRPWYVEPGTPAAANPALTVTGNAPAFFAATTFGTLFPSPDFSFSADTGIWHYPGPTIKGTKGRPIRVQWLNQLTNRIFPGFDPTVDCTDAAPNCFPFNRIVTHVHGAHVGPESDGLTQAYYNPDFSNVGLLYSSFLNPTPTVDVYGKYHVGPKGTYRYPMDQEAGTIWYHDHAAGSTHTTVNQGLAGFFPITDDNEKCLQGIPNATLCPAPVKYLPTGSGLGTPPDTTAYELGFALQDRTFYASNGHFAMPDAPIIDGRFPTCDPLTPASRLATCAPLFMYAKHAANAASLTPAGIHQVPYDETTIDTTIPENATAPVLASSATLEFFGNMPVVNGVVYGKYDVEPRVYRMRLLNGSDSRTWVLQLQAYNNLGASLGFVNFYQIGTEQGFLNAPALRTQMLLMPGERVDVLVDFTNTLVSGLPAGTTRVVMNNLGPDAPYQGEVILPQNRSIDIPEIMVFDVLAAKAVGSAADTPIASVTNLRPISGAIAPITTVNNYRKIALEEIVDEYQRIMPTIDRRGYNLPGIPSTEIIRVNDIEEWDIINTTADAHPMHLHQVAFQVISRTPFAGNTFVPAVNDLLTNTFIEPSYTASGPAVLPGPEDSGWKDTVFAPPGFVTKLRAKFDLVGEYVWHCHILSHEEHDMMRPMNIVASSVSPPTGTLVLPAVSTNARTALVSVGASTTISVPIKYIYEFKLATDLEWTTNISSTAAATLTFPKDGVYSVRVKAADASVPIQGAPTYASVTFAPSTYVNAANTILVGPYDSLTPSSGTIVGTSQAFILPAMVTPVTARTLLVGSTPGGSDLGRYTVNALTAVTAINLPTNGLPVYFTLWVKVVTTVNGSTVTEMRKNEYIFTASSQYVSPSGAIGNTPLPIFTWAQDVTALSYNFYLAYPGGGARIVSAVAATCGAGTCSYTLPAPSLPTGSYTWYIQKVLAGGPVPWDTGRAFSVQIPAAPAAVVLGAPVGAVGNTPLPTFAWTQDATATSYNLYLAYPGGGARIVNAVAATCTAGSCSYTLTAPSLPTGAYTWYVQGVNAVGAGPWGAGQAFSVALTVAPGAVTQLAPTGAGAAAFPTLQWTAVAGATSYNVNLLYAGGASRNYPNATATCTAGTCYYSLPAPSLPTGSYTWYVQAVNSAGEGPWGAGQAFSVVQAAPPGTVSQLSPTGPGAPAAPTFQWTAVTGATYYNLFLSYPGGAARTFPGVAATCTAGTCSFALPAPSLPIGSYTWYVQGVNSAGNGPWGTGMIFSLP